MELNKNKKVFTLAVNDVKALEKAMDFVNASTGSDYELVEYYVAESGVAKISVSEINAQCLFSIGIRYEMFCEKLDINW